MPAPASDCIVVGAGVAGLSAALYLRRAGLPVTVIDPLPSPGGASFGNAGLISPDTPAPIAMPGMLRKVPGWLRDPLGPLSVPPRYFLHALPWLLRWIRAGRMDRVLEISDALRALHAPAFECWKEMLGSDSFHDLFRPAGVVQVWDSATESASAAVERQLRERHRIPAEVLTADDLRQMFPGIARDVQRGLLITGNGYTVSPPRLIRTLAERVRAAGATIVAERAMKLIPRDGGWMVMTNIANRSAKHVVVAGGAWSGKLLEPLGVRVPLETERGYHAMIAKPSLSLKLPLMLKDRGFGMTPLEDGIRIAGTVEIAGLEAPPNEQRARILLERARRLFPDLRGEEPTLWMGFRPSIPDSLPVLGPVPDQPGLHLCFGHGHYGMTAAPPSGRIVARLIAGERPPIDPQPYAITRFAA